MKSYAERIEEKRKEAAEAIARLEQEERIAALLPAGADRPRHIMLGGTFDRCPWLCYRVKTLADAVALARLFPAPAEVSAREAGCLSVNPPELQDKRYAEGKERWTEPALVEIAQHGGKGFYSCCLSFWVQDFAGLPWARIKIDVDALQWKLRASISARYDRHGDVIEATFRDSEPMRAACTQRVKYGSGSLDAFDVRYFFSGPDHLEDFLRNFPEAA